MINNLAAHIALRNRLLGVSVATTGLTSLSVSSAGYVRASGSFVTEGFEPGMEVVGSGFIAGGNNAAPHIVSEVAALVMKCSGVTPEIADTGRSVSCGLPLIRLFENAKTERTPGRPYVEESYVPATGSVESFPAQGAHREDRGLYVVRWYGLTGYGVAALRRSTDKVLELFAPGTKLIAGADVVYVREGDNIPYAGEVIRLDGGWSAIVVTIPWRAYTTNVVVA